MIEPIGIAGTGRVARALGRLLHENGMPVGYVGSRHPEGALAAARSIGPGVQPAEYGELGSRVSRLVVAVSDAALAEVAAAVASGATRVRVALHTCGTRGPEALEALTHRGVCCGTLHPLQTFTDSKADPAAARGISFAVWGEECALAWAGEIAALAGGQILRIPPPARPLYHAAAVMASNYLVALIGAAQTLMAAAGIEDTDALRALGPLVRTSVNNVLTHGPAAALTGPIERGDRDTVEAHLGALSAMPEPVQRLYSAAGVVTVQLARRRGLPAESAAAFEQLFQKK